MKKDYPKFPMFVDLSRWKIYIYGGGAVATRRVETLRHFGPDITVVSPRISEKLRAILKEDPGIFSWDARSYHTNEIPAYGNVDLVLAATSDADLNHEIVRVCREHGIRVNNASNKEECDFYFPAIIFDENLVMGITSDGSDHRKVRKTAAYLRECLADPARKESQLMMNTEKKILCRIGTRESRLAVIQAEMVADFIDQVPGHVAELVTMKTTGDKILDRRLDRIGGKGLFVKELDLALKDGRSDLSVHSAKDLPMEVPEELPLVGFSRREDPRDVLVLPAGCREWDQSLPVGCSSLRRMVQLQALFPGIRFENVRGNVLTRLRKLDEGQYGALVLAAAGLKRLGLADRISRYFTTEEMIPAAGQGILALQGRAGENYSFLGGFLDEEAGYCITAERAYVRELDGGCSSPIAAHAVVENGRLKLRALYYSEEEKKFVTGTREGKPQEAENLGIALAQQLRAEMKGKK